MHLREGRPFFLVVLVNDAVGEAESEVVGKVVRRRRWRDQVDQRLVEARHDKIVAQELGLDGRRTHLKVDILENR